MSGPVRRPSAQDPGRPAPERRARPAPRPWRGTSGRPAPAAGRCRPRLGPRSGRAPRPGSRPVRSAPASPPRPPVRPTRSSPTRIRTPRSPPPPSCQRRANGARSSGEMRDAWNGRPRSSAPIHGRTGSGQPDGRATRRQRSGREGRRHVHEPAVVRAARRRRPASRPDRRRSGRPARRGRSPERRTRRDQNPGATARTNRPPLTWSSVMACLASHVTSRSGRTAALRPRRAVGNLPANHASSVQGSMAPDQVGKSGLCRSPSPSQRVSMSPSTASAASASDTGTAGGER